MCYNDTFCAKLSVFSTICSEVIPFCPSHEIAVLCIFHYSLIARRKKLVEVIILKSSSTASVLHPKSTIQKARQNIGLLFIMPWVIGFLVFQLYPFIVSFFYSFTDYNMVREPSFIGLKNYLRLFTTDPDFTKSFMATIYYTVFSVPAKLVFALLVALVMNSKLKGIGMFRTVFYLPSILGGSVAIAALWKIMFMREGLVNQMLGYLGAPAIDWLSIPGTAMFTICLIQVWQFGSSMVLFLAALKQIPNSLYEAATIDGASKLRQFFKITLPMISSIIFFNLIMQSITALQNFTSAFIVTRGGPLKSTYVLGMKLYKDGFGSFKMGYACSISWVIFAMVLVLTVALFASSKKWVYYEDEGEF